MTPAVSAGGGGGWAEGRRVAVKENNCKWTKSLTEMLGLEAPQTSENVL